MNPSSARRPAAGTFAALVLLAGAARAAEGEEQTSLLQGLDTTLHIWAAPEGSASRGDSPFAPAAGSAGLGEQRARGEAEVRLRRGGLTADLSARSTALRGRRLETRGLANELFYEGEALGQHLTLGKKVLSWDVGFAFRPLDLVQQEDRRAFFPFALEGVPLLAWEHFDADAAWALVYANPLRGRAAAPRDDEAVALRHYRRLGPVDLHLVGRYGERTRLQAGAAAVAVVGDGFALHGSFRWQRIGQRLVVEPPPGDPPLSASDPVTTEVVHDPLAALVGATFNPGWELTMVVEAWFDPAGATADAWSSLGALAERQRAALDGGGARAAAATGDLAWELRAFDRPNLLRENLVVRASRSWDRVEAALDLLYTPEDGGWVATATTTYAGEQVSLAGGLRLLGGPPRSAYRLLPESAIFYVAWQLHL